MSDFLKSKFLNILSVLICLIFISIASSGDFLFNINISSVTAIICLAVMIRFVIADGQILPLKFINSKNEYYRYHYFHFLSISFLLTTIFSAIEFASYNIESLLFSDKNGIVSIYLLCTSIIVTNIIFIYLVSKETIELGRHKLFYKFFDNFKFYINCSLVTVFIINLMVWLITAKEIGFDRTGNILDVKGLFYFIFYSSNDFIPSFKSILNFLFISGFSLILCFLSLASHKVSKILLLYRSFSIYSKSFGMMFVAGSWVKLFELSNDILLKDLSDNFFMLLIIYFINYPLELIERKKGTAFEKKMFLRPPKSSSSSNLTYLYLILALIGFIMANYANFENFNLAYQLISLSLFFLLIFTIKNKIVMEDKVRERTIDLYEEKAKVDKLLGNILPNYVIEELKNTNTSAPRKFKKVSVLFTDFVGFTSIASTMQPTQLVKELNDIFTEFDNIIEKHKCDRIKTIGDAYMAAGGLSHEEKNPTAKTLLAALEFIEYLKKRNQTSLVKWNIRIGISQGEIVAGIVGVKKYLFDVFGDTVNIAARMESNSEAMKINVSEEVYYELRDKFSFESRGFVEVKGKGKMKMYFVVGQKYEQEKEHSIFFFFAVASLLIWLTTLQGEESYHFLLKKACNQNIKKACHSLGYLLFDGNKEKRKNGLKFNKKSCSLKHGPSCFSLGLYYQSAGNIENAKKYYKKSCDYKISGGCISYGGLIKENSFEEALTYLKIACNMENPNGCNQLSLLIEQVDPESEDIVKYSYRACSLNGLLGCNNLGRWQKKENKINSALKNYTKACNVNNYEACYNLAIHYTIETPKGLAAAKKACSLGSDKACFKIANFYQLNNYIDEAISFYKKSCSNKSEKGCVELLKLNDSIENQKVTTKVFDKLCNQGNSVHCITLGDIFTGHEKYLRGAENYYKACMLEDSLGCEYSGNIYKNLGNNDMAKSLYKLSCKYDPANGCESLNALNLIEKK